MIVVVLFLMASVLCAVDRQGVRGYPFSEEEFEICRPANAPDFHWSLSKEDVFPVIHHYDQEIAVRYEQLTCDDGRVTFDAKNSGILTMMMHAGVVRFSYENALPQETSWISECWDIGKVIGGYPKTDCLCWGDQEKAKVMWFRYEAKGQDAQVGYFIGGEVMYASFLDPKLVWGLAYYNGQTLGEYKMPVDFCSYA